MRPRRLVPGQRAALGHPLLPAAVQQPHVAVAEETEDPERVRRPPVEVVAVEDDRVVPADALGLAQRGERGRVEVVPGDLVVQLEVPVDLDRAGDVAGVVEQHVLVRLDDHQAGRVEVGGQPLGGDQLVGVRVRLQWRRRIVRNGHGCHATSRVIALGRSGSRCRALRGDLVAGRAAGQPALDPGARCWPAQRRSAPRASSHGGGAGRRRHQQPLLVDADAQRGQHVAGDPAVPGRRQVQPVGAPQQRVVERVVGEQVDQVRAVPLGQLADASLSDRRARADDPLAGQPGVTSANRNRTTSAPADPQLGRPPGRTGRPGRPGRTCGAARRCRRPRS